MKIFKQSRLFKAGTGFICLATLLLPGMQEVYSDENFYLKDVPDYHWHAGCFGTACGNLIGFWDRNGYPDMYTGPTNDGLAPLKSTGDNQSITAMWASASGLDGRPTDKPGHMEDYWMNYEFVGPDPYVTAGRTEHEPDCIGDFIGLNQNKWKDLNGECDGNIDGFSFVFWDESGDRMWNHQPVDQDGQPIPDIPSGLYNWSRFRGYQADVWSQLSDFNPLTPEGKGFTFEDMKRELQAGYPVLIYMQDFETMSRTLDGVSDINPDIHGMLAYGYLERSSGEKFVRFRTSWASGDSRLAEWQPNNWVVLSGSFPVRGFMGFHPRPKITNIQRDENAVTFTWTGPESVMINAEIESEIPLNYYVIEASHQLGDDTFSSITEPTSDHTVTVENCCDGPVFYRLKLLSPEEAQTYTGL